MKLSASVITGACALILLIIAVPFALVQLDLMRASGLRLVPPAIAVVLAGAGLVAVVSMRNAQARKKK